MEKIIKRVLVPIICCVMIFMSGTITVHAESYCRISFFSRADEYTGNIGLILVSDQSESSQIVLKLDEDGMISGAGMFAQNRTWKLLEVQFEQTGWELKGFPDEIAIDDEEAFMIDFEVVKKVGEEVEDITRGEKEDVADSNNEESELSVTASAEAIFNAFKEITKPLAQDDSSLFLYARFLNEYLSYDPMGSEEEWKAMTDYQHFVKYVLGICPNIHLTQEGFSSADDFIKNGFENTGIRQGLENRGISSDIIDAIIICWKWEWVYYNENGKFYDLSSGVKHTVETEAPTDENDIGNLEEAINDLIKDTEHRVDSVEIKDNPVISEEKTNRFIENFKKNWVTFTLMIVVGLGYLFFYLKRKKKSKSE